VGKYALLIVLIAIMQYFNMLFINIFRIKNMINAVTFNQSIIVLLNFACIFFFQKETLIMMLVCGYVLGNLLCIVLALYDKIIPPYKQWQLHINIQKEILKKGMYLFLYNSCFYFIIISIRTIVSIYYSVEQFGMFTFSFTLGHAIMLLLDAFSFIIFPKIIDKLSSPNIAQIKDTLTKLRTYYISLAHLLIFTALPLFPLLLHFFPKYQEGLLALNLIALTIVMNAYNFGYTSLLIARNKEKWSAVISFCALVINCLLGITMVKIFHVDFSYVILATMITYLLFSFATIVAGRKLLNLHGGIWRDERKIIINLGCPLLLALAFSIVNETFIWTPLALYLVLNYKDVKTIKNMVTRIVKSPNVVNL
jgi:O-antigen/teichoic acid export membrane protein